MGFEAEGFYGPYILPVNQTNSVKALNVLRQQNEQHQLQFVSLSVIFINSIGSYDKECYNQNCKPIEIDFFNVLLGKVKLKPCFLHP